MSYITVEVEIEHGRIVSREPDRLPEKARGLLTILPARPGDVEGPQRARERVELSLIHGDGKRLIDPKSEELDASLWGD